MKSTNARSITTILSEQDLAEAMTRLQASREEWEMEQERKYYEAGFGAGVRWAAKKARHVELRNRQEFRESFDDELGDDFDQYLDECYDCEESSYRHVMRLGLIIRKGHEAGPDLQEDWRFRSTLDDKAIPSPHWDKGFVLGALELFDAVED